MTWQADRPELVLASGSAARRALLTSAGLRFSVRPASVDEAELKRSAQADGLAPADAAILLAAMKASRIAASDQDALVIGADQLLICGDRWFDKPETVEDARQHLAALRGRTHMLVTAVVCHQGARRLWHHVAEPRLVMRRFSDAFLGSYLAGEGASVCDTVGAYRIEGLGVQLFEQIIGEHAAIMGLPLLPLLGFLRTLGVIAT